MRCCAASLGRPPSGQHQMPGAVRGQILGDVPVRPHPARRSPDMLRHHVVPAVLRSAGLRAGTAGQSRPPDPAARSGLRSRGAASMWSINRTTRRRRPRTDPPARPTVVDVPEGSVRPNPHRQDCTGDTVSALVTRCAPRVTSQIGVRRARLATAARKSRRVPPRTRCCIRSSDCVDGAPSGSRAARCRMRSVGSLCCGGAQRGFEPFLVRVGHRQPEDPVPVPACGQRVG